MPSVEYKRLFNCYTQISAVSVELDTTCHAMRWVMRPALQSARAAAAADWLLSDSSQCDSAWRRRDRPWAGRTRPVHSDASTTGLSRRNRRRCKAADKLGRSLATSSVLGGRHHPVCDCYVVHLQAIIGSNYKEERHQLYDQEIWICGMYYTSISQHFNCWSNFGYTGNKIIWQSNRSAMPQPFIWLANNLQVLNHFST